MRTSFWELGFRPFFFLGSLHALIVMMLWVGYLAGVVPRLGSVDPILWHSHEMIYGFTSAIVVGFVLTAAQNWTGVRGVHGRPLQVLALLWIMARILILLPFVPTAITAMVDLSFYPLASIYMIPYLKDPELKVERVFYVLFGLLFVGNLLFYLQVANWVPGHALSGILLGLDTIIIVIVFMGGRVIPFFTESSIARAQPKVRKWVEAGSAISVVLFLISEFLQLKPVLFAPIAFAAALIHLIRLSGWWVKRIKRAPLIWVLHVGYLWLVIGFFLSGFAALGWLAKSLAIHAFTVGCIGVIIHGMISRVSLGHTGRRLHPSRMIVVGYVSLVISSFVRVLCPVILPEYYRLFLIVSGFLWMLAFSIFLAIYTPMLFSRRVDGRPG